MNSKNIVNNKRKLIIVFHDMTLGGIQRKVIDIINYIEKKYPNIEIILFLQNKKGIFLKKIPNNIQIKSPKIHSKRFNAIWFTWWLMIQFTKEKPTKILSFMDLGAIPTLMALKFVFWEKPEVIIGEDILTSKYVFTETRPFLRLKLIKYFYPRASLILVQTLIQKKDLEKILEKKLNKIIVSPNWLPLDFTPTTTTKTKTRKIDILFIGRIEAQKNLFKFIKIIKNISLSKEFSKIKVAIVGQGSQTMEIKRFIKKKGLDKNIKILPPTINPIDFYLKAKIFLLTSDYEGFPLTLLESISCGCSPVVNDIPEIHNFFKKGGNSILFENEQMAVNLIKNNLLSPNQDLMRYYQNKIIKLQQKNISFFVKQLV